MTTQTSFSFPTSIECGSGLIQTIGKPLQALGIDRPLVVCDRFLPETEAFEKVGGALQQAGLVEDMTLFREVHPNPVEADVRGAAEAFRRGTCNGIIGLGGGSALDVAKVCRLLIEDPGFALEDSKKLYEKAWTDLPPFVAIPTTAGTGSEVGRSSVITLETTGAKAVIFHPKLLADHVILDASLTVSLPAHLTAATGLDALTHCIESFTSPVLHPLCDGIALEGIGMVAEHCLNAVQEPDNLEARQGMLLAAMMGGIAFQKDLGSTHSMAHPLSNLCHLHHGLANALCLSAVMRWNASKKPGLYARVAVAAGQSFGDPAQGDQAAIQWVESLIEACGISTGLAHHGVDEEQLEALADLAIQDPCHQTNPISMTRDDFLTLYRQCL